MVKILNKQPFLWESDGDLTRSHGKDQGQNPEKRMLERSHHPVRETRPPLLRQEGGFRDIGRQHAGV